MRKSALRLMSLTIGLNMIIFGAHQIARPRLWTHYIPSWLDDLLPVTRPVAMRFHGTGNVSLGSLLMYAYLARYPWVLAAMWWSFVAPICGRIDWKAGVRDVSILSAIIAGIVLVRDE